MISKHISCKASNDNYKRLAEYIAAAKHTKKQEKLLHSWCAGCIDNEDYESSITEVELTQSLNTRTNKEKTYHLIVSFRKEDEGKLTEEDYKNIEQEVEKGEVPLQEEILTVGMYGEEVDFYTLKGMIENILEAINVEHYEVEKEMKNASYHPGRCANIKVGMDLIATLRRSASRSIRQLCYL